MDIATTYGLSYGLALASGVNAYFPLLAYIVAARWFNLYHINPHFAFITQPWFIAVIGILALADLIADKIPLIDHGWDAIHTVIRPVAGAFIVAASDNQIHVLPNSTFVGTHIVPMGINVSLSFAIVVAIGAALALISHIVKASTRIASTATTAGILNIFISILENISVLIMTLLALFAPVVMFAIVIVFVLVFLLLARTIFRHFSRQRRQSYRYQ